MSVNGSPNNDCATCAANTASAGSVRSGVSGAAVSAGSFSVFFGSVVSFPPHAVEVRNTAIRSDIRAFKVLRAICKSYQSIDGSQPRHTLLFRFLKRQANNT